MIKIKNIELFNFISFWGGPHKLDIDGQDLLLILGNVDNIKSNGAGKTSLVNSIAWCLFGEIPGYGNPSDRIINSDNISSGTYVKITTIDGYQITRYRKYKGKTGLEIIDNGSDISLMTTTENQQLINEIFSISYESFIVSIFLSASEKSFIDMSPLKRFNIISDLLDINRLNKIESKTRKLLDQHTKSLEECQSQINNINTQIKILEKEKNTRLTSFTDYKNELGQNLKNMLNKKKDILEKLKNIDIQQINKDLEIWKEYDEKIKLLDDTKKQIEIANNNLNNLKEKVENHPIKNEIKLMKSRLIELNEKYKSIQYNIEKSDIESIRRNLKLWEEYNKKLEDISKLKEEIKEIELNISTLKFNMESKIDINELKKQHELYNQNEKNKTQKNIIIDRLKNIREQQLELKNEKREFQKLDNICPLCHQPIDEEYKNNIINNFDNKINEIRKTLKKEYDRYNNIIIEDIIHPKMTINEAIKHNEKIDKLSEKIDKLQDILNQKNDQLKSINITKPSIEFDVLIKMQSRYNLLIERSKEIEKDIKLLNNQLDQKTKEYENEIKKINNSINDTIKLIATKQQYMNSIEIIKPSKDKQSLIDIKMDFKSLKSNLDQLEENYKLLQEQFNSRKVKFREIIKDLDEKLAKLNTELEFNQNKYDKTKVIYNHTKVLYDIFHDKDKLKSHIINIFLDIFNKQLNNYLQSFGWNINLSFDKKLNLSSTRLFSSGEKRRINLAISFALLYAKFTLYGSYSNFIILDEIDNGLDEEGIEKLISILQDLLDREFVSSIIILTHKSDLKDYIDNRLIIIKNKQRSKIVKKIQNGHIK